MKTNIFTKKINQIMILVLGISFLMITNLNGQINDLSFSDTEIEITDGLRTNNALSVNENDSKIEAWMSNTQFWTDLGLLIDIEPELKIEDWMMSSNMWIQGNNPGIESEESMEIECWMMSNDFWDDETENKLNIEAWMSDSNYWQSNNNDEGLKLQCWMKDSKYWNYLISSIDEDELKIKPWMFDSNYWNN